MLYQAEFHNIKNVAKNAHCPSEEIVKTGFKKSIQDSALQFSKFTKLFFDDDAVDMDDENCSTAASKNFVSENEKVHSELIQKAQNLFKTVGEDFDDCSSLEENSYEGYSSDSDQDVQEAT